MKRVAIVILNWNGASFLERFLPGVISDSSHLARIIVADNASTDGSVELLGSNFPQVEILRLDRNFGFTGGYNRALAQLDVEYFLLLNSDVETSSGWLEPLLDWMDNHPETAACQPKIRSYEHRELFEHAGACGGFIDKFGYPFCRGRIMQSLEVDNGQYDSPLPVFWATGACMMVRSSLFKKAGGFDERFFAHMEEIDLCWRLMKYGHNIMAIPQSTVYHVGGGTLPKKNPRKTFYNFRNNLLMLTKNLSWPILLWMIPIRLLLDGVAGLKFLLEGDAKDTWAVVQAHFSFYRLSVQSIANRKESPQRSMNRIGIYQGSILFDFYFRRIRSFDRLPIHRFPSRP